MANTMLLTIVYNVIHSGCCAGAHHIWSILSPNQQIPYDGQKKGLASSMKRLLKGEPKRRNLTYADLAERRAAVSIKDNARNISNKIGRGVLSAVFFVQCVEAIDCRTIHPDES